MKIIMNVNEARGLEKIQVVRGAFEMLKTTMDAICINITQIDATGYVCSELETTDNWTDMNLTYLSNGGIVHYTETGLETVFFGSMDYILTTCDFDAHQIVVHFE